MWNFVLSKSFSVGLRPIFIDVTRCAGWNIGKSTGIPARLIRDQQEGIKPEVTKKNVSIRCVPEFHVMVDANRIVCECAQPRAKGDLLYAKDIFLYEGSAL